MPITLLQPDGSDGSDDAINCYMEYESPQYNDSLQNSARTMRRIIGRFKEVVGNSSWYWHTSHQSLCLNRWNDPPVHCIQICAAGLTGQTWFTVGYKMKEHDAPWPNAWVQMTPTDETQAIAAIEVAIKNCCDIKLAGKTDRE